MRDQKNKFLVLKFTPPSKTMDKACGCLSCEMQKGPSIDAIIYSATLFSRISTSVCTGIFYEISDIGECQGKENYEE